MLGDMKCDIRILASTHGAVGLATCSPALAAAFVAAELGHPKETVWLQNIKSLRWDLPSEGVPTAAVLGMAASSQRLLREPPPRKVLGGSLQVPTERRRSGEASKDQPQGEPLSQGVQLTPAALCALRCWKAGSGHSPQAQVS